MRKKEQMFWLASRSRMWRIPLCMAAFSLLPSAYSFASAENPATETVLAVNSVQQQRTVKGIAVSYTHLTLPTIYSIRCIGW